ncbi:hypothetical protein GCM10008965_48310 [Methylorubrum aminovorans]
MKIFAADLPAASRLPNAKDGYVIPPEILCAFHALGVKAAGTAPNAEEALKLLQVPSARTSGQTGLKDCLESGRGLSIGVQ